MKLFACKTVVLFVVLIYIYMRSTGIDDPASVFIYL